MGPKLAINLFSIGLGATLLLTFEGLSSSDLGRVFPFIVLALIVTIAGGVRILQIKARQRL